MIYEARPEPIQYTPTTRARRRHFVKKVLSFLGFGLMGGFAIWYAWPGIAGSPAPLDPGYWTFLAGLFLAAVAILFLVVVTWNERLPRIRDGVMELPFPVQRTNRSRTIRIRLDEIASVELTTNSIGLPGAEIFLRDRTRLFLPDRVFGDAGRKVLEVLATHVSQRSSEPRETRALP